MAARLCGECGAGLEARAALCPLCGSFAPVAEAVIEPQEPSDIDGYQSNVRRLREQLRQLREGAEAV